MKLIQIFQINQKINIIFVFAIPGWKKASRVKKYYSSEFANEILNSKYRKIIANDTKTAEPKDIIGKATIKL